MRKLFTGAIALALAMAAVTSTANAAEVCWRTEEMNAAKVRNLQSQLMVAALECSKSGLGNDRLYDRFISSNRGALIGFNDAIKMYFARAYGVAEGRHAYDQFTTALANRQAVRAATTEDFCRSADTLMRLALDARPNELVALASDVEERPFGVGVTCDEARDIGVEHPVLRADVAIANPEPLPAPEPIYTADSRDADVGSRNYDDADASLAASPLPASAPIVAASAPMMTAPLPPVAVPAVAVAAVAPTPVPAAIKAVKPAPTARPTQAEALAAAVQALQAATEALKASAAATPIATPIADAPVDAAPVIHERAAPAHRS